MVGQIKSVKGAGKSDGDGDSGLEQTENLLGPTYNYIAHIKTPLELGMSAEGTFDALADDVAGLLGYVDLLVSGSCTFGTCAGKMKNPNGTTSTYRGPLGNKFFLDTIVTCKDPTGEEHKRSIYINNVPDGSIPFVSNFDSNLKFPGLSGILPGTLGNLAQIHPLQILTAFSNGSSPTCQLVTMETIDTDNNKGSDSRYITNDDIAVMPSSWFPSDQPKDGYDVTVSSPPEEPDESEASDNKVDSFGTMHSTLHGSRVDYSKMPNDIVIKFYYSMLGLLGLYILLRMMFKKR